MQYPVTGHTRKAPPFCGLATELPKMHNFSPIIAKPQTEPNGATLHTKGPALFESIMKGKEGLRNSHRLEETKEWSRPNAT